MQITRKPSEMVLKATVLPLLVNSWHTGFIMIYNVLHTWTVDPYRE